jgi:outer membrane protein assembly factor BamB
MLSFSKEKYLLLAVILAGLMLVFFWMIYNPAGNFKKSIPGMDNRPDSIAESSQVVVIGEKFQRFSNEESPLRGKWSRFRGSDFDNINKENIPLIDRFSESNAQIKWKVDLGEGHAAPAIYNGKVYLLDYLENEKADALRCFSLETGEELWRRSYSVHVKRNHGMSRTVPVVTDDFVLTIGPLGHVMCCNPVSGDLIWGLDMVKTYDTEIPFWYTGQCPLIDSGMAILAPGGSSLMVAVDCATGKVVWETPNPDRWQMSHSSIMPMTCNGKKMYVYAAVGGICGVSATGEDVGSILWKFTDFAPNVVAPSPLILPDGNIFMTAGYGAGSVLFQVTQMAGKFHTTVVQQFKPKEGVASEQQTAIYWKKHMFIILPKDAGMNRNQLACCWPDDVQNILWTSGKKEHFGLGPYILADGKFFIVSDDGTLTIARASVSGFEVLDKKRIIEGQDAWGPIAIADGSLLMRDSKQMVCLDIHK